MHTHTRTPYMRACIACHCVDILTVRFVSMVLKYLYMIRCTHTTSTHTGICSFSHHLDLHSLCLYVGTALPPLTKFVCVHTRATHIVRWSRVPTMTKCLHAPTPIYTPWMRACIARHYVHTFTMHIALHLIRFFPGLSLVIWIALWTSRALADTVHTHRCLHCSNLVVHRGRHQYGASYT